MRVDKSIVSEKVLANLDKHRLRHASVCQFRKLNESRLSCSESEIPTTHLSILDHELMWKTLMVRKYFVDNLVSASCLPDTVGPASPGLAAFRVAIFPSFFGICDLLRFGLEFRDFGYENTNFLKRFLRPLSAGLKSAVVDRYIDMCKVIELLNFPESWNIERKNK
jgi:hypothetical protein